MKDADLAKLRASLAALAVQAEKDFPAIFKKGSSGLLIVATALAMEITVQEGFRTLAVSMAADLLAASQFTPEDPK